MRRIVLLFFIFFLFSCGGIHQVTAPMSHMPMKWRGAFQEMAIITYKEYREVYTIETAVRLTNEKMARIMLNVSEKHLKKFEECAFRHKQ